MFKNISKLLMSVILNMISNYLFIMGFWTDLCIGCRVSVCVIYARNNSVKVVNIRICV